MTILHIESGVCGFQTDDHVFKSKRRSVGLAIESDCRQIAVLSEKLRKLDMMDVIKGPINENTVYIKAGECGVHSSCPVPCGIVKAAEAELGLALPRNIKIEFKSEE